MLINRSQREQRLTLHPDDMPQGPDGETQVTLANELTDVLTGEANWPENNTMTVALPPLTARLFLTGTR